MDSGNFGPANYPNGACTPQHPGQLQQHQHQHQHPQQQQAPHQQDVRLHSREHRAIYDCIDPILRALQQSHHRAPPPPPAQPLLGFAGTDALNQGWHEQQELRARPCADLASSAAYELVGNKSDVHSRQLTRANFEQSAALQYTHQRHSNHQREHQHFAASEPQLQQVPPVSAMAGGSGSGNNNNKNNSDHDRDKDESADQDRSQQHMSYQLRSAAALLGSMCAHSEQRPLAPLASGWPAASLRASQPQAAQLTQGDPHACANSPSASNSPHGSLGADAYPHQEQLRGVFHTMLMQQQHQQHAHNDRHGVRQHAQSRGDLTGPSPAGLTPAAAVLAARYGLYSTLRSYAALTHTYMSRGGLASAADSAPTLPLAGGGGGGGFFGGAHSAPTLASEPAYGVCGRAREHDHDGPTDAGHSGAGAGAHANADDCDGYDEAGDKTSKGLAKARQRRDQRPAAAAATLGAEGDVQGVRDYARRAISFEKLQFSCDGASSEDSTMSGLDEQSEQFDARGCGSPGALCFSLANEAPPQQQQHNHHNPHNPHHNPHNPHHNHHHNHHHNWQQARRDKATDEKTCSPSPCSIRYAPRVEGHRDNDHHQSRNQHDLRKPTRECDDKGVRKDGVKMANIAPNDDAHRRPASRPAEARDMTSPECDETALESRPDKQLDGGAGGSSGATACNNGRVRTAYSSMQILNLEREFANNMYLSRIRRIELAQKLSLSEKQVKIWFQNRRVKYKKENST